MEDYVCVSMACTVLGSGIVTNFVCQMRYKDFCLGFFAVVVIKALSFCNAGSCLASPRLEIRFSVGSCIALRMVFLSLIVDFVENSIFRCCIR